MSHVLKVVIFYLRSKCHTRICIFVRLIYLTLVYVLRSTCVYYFLPSNYYKRTVCMAVSFYLILHDIPSVSSIIPLVNMLYLIMMFLFLLLFPFSYVLLLYLSHNANASVKVVSISQC